MSYSSEFIANSDSARKLLLESGYSSEAAINAITLIGELCIFSKLTSELTEEHVKGERLPAYFETEFSIEPMDLRGSTTVNLMDRLEEGNVLVPRGQKHRVMLSNMMNRIFNLTAAHEISGSIRGELEKLRTAEIFEDVLDTIEFEIVSALHENIDIKYLDIPLLEKTHVPTELLGILSDALDLSDELKQNGIDLNDTIVSVINALGKKGQGEKASLVIAYYYKVLNLSQIISMEATDQWQVILGASSYPRSILNRSGPPLIQSSMSLKSDFAHHPLIEKFQQLIKMNHEKIGQLADVYEDHISEAVDSISKLPKGIQILELLMERFEGLPEVTAIQTAWDKIEKYAPALKAQAKMFERLVASMDRLFTKNE